ncbi:GNAT family N-acetyltransferase [Erythrobacter alti]|uniref:GNAT family N-acetyltransferase n=1 Tax=Erythrobacter alti TaxID=1896145 RepID=UPI0030F4588A
MTAISYHDTFNDLQDLDWQSEGPFARLAWFELLEERGATPSIALAKDGEEAVALPLHQTADGMDTLSNWYAFTWSYLCTSGVDEASLLKQLARNLANRTSRVDFAKIAEEDGTVERLHHAFRAAGWLVLRSPCDSNHILRINSRKYADYLAGRPGKVRTTLKRKTKKLEVSLTKHFSADDWAAYEEIYANSWKPSEGDPELLRSFAEAESARGHFRFAIARHEGTPVAAQFWTVEDGVAYIHKLAHREDASALSPGTILTAALLEYVIDTDHVTLVDFGTGDDPYKAEWMEEVRTRWQLTCLRPANPRNWPTLGRAALRKLVSRPSAG